MNASVENTRLPGQIRHHAEPAKESCVAAGSKPAADPSASASVSRSKSIGPEATAYLRHRDRRRQLRPLALPRLRRRMIDLEDPQAAGHRRAVGERIEARAQRHELPRAVARRDRQSVFGDPRARRDEPANPRTRRGRASACAQRRLRRPRRGCAAASGSGRDRTRRPAPDAPRAGARRPARSDLVGPAASSNVREPRSRCPCGEPGHDVLRSDRFAPRKRETPAIVSGTRARMGLDQASQNWPHVQVEPAQKNPGREAAGRLRHGCFLVATQKW